jgi:hypothetical protein
MYSNKQNKLYLLCMRQILKEITKINTLFQSQQDDVLKLTEDLLNMFVTLMQFVVIPDELAKCDITDTLVFQFRNHLKQYVHFGYEFEQLASTLPLEDSSVVREECAKFVVELIAQVQTRLPDNIRVLLLLSTLHPAVATSQNKPSIAPLAAHFYQIVTDMDQVENEWNSLHLVTWPTECVGDTVKF